MDKRHLDLWIAEKTGIKKLSRQQLEEYQWDKIKETFNRAAACSPFYAELYKGVELNCFEDFRRLPFTTPEDVCEYGLDMVCVPQSEISRIVTMETSGTTGKPKRIFFTAEDQELTIDFFHHGMKFIADEDDVFMILMPCSTPGSIGVLLKEALERDNVKVVPYGLPDGQDTEKILEIMEKERITGCVAVPAQMMRIAAASAGYDIPMRNVLLSADYVSQESRETITAAWGCRIFEHYGMTEMGLGCAVHCSELDGCHIRENDLYLEIIDPITGKVLPDGEEGEIVFTTLTRRGMPFIRYRTGDRSSLMKELCSCGSVLKRITRVGDRRMEKGGHHGE